MNNKYKGKLLEIVTYPDKILRKKAKDINNIKSDENQQLIADMILTMQIKDGVGLAGPQVGINKKIFIVNDGNGVQVIINPRIIFKSFKKNVMEEGCLSIPKVYGLVTRPENIWIFYKNNFGKLQFKKATQLLARIIQHENDHLLGILFIDKTDKITNGQNFLTEYKNNVKE